MAEIALLVALGMVLAFAGWLVWRATQGEDRRRDADHRLVLELVTRIRAKDATEIAQADLLRQAAKSEEDMRMAVEQTLSSEIQDQWKRGFFGDLGMVRAAMVKAGLDPEDDEHVRLWNERYGAVQ